MNALDRIEAAVRKRLDKAICRIESVGRGQRGDGERDGLRQVLRLIAAERKREAEDVAK